MNVLYVCHRFPYPPSRGGKIRPFNMIRHLSEQGHRVTVCSLARSAEEAAAASGVAPYCERFECVRVSAPTQALRMVLRLAGRTPSSMGYFFSARLARRVRDLLAKRGWDLILVHCSSVAQYVEHENRVPKLLDFGDMDSQKWLEYAKHRSFPLRLGYALEGAKMVRAEKRLSEKFDLCTTTTRAEWETLEGFRTGVATDWFPNGVDTSFFRPDGEAPNPDTISFVGRMDYYPNQECMLRFCKQTWPLLRARRPDAKLLIIGADPSAEIRDLGSLAGVTVTGSVKDVRPYVRSSAVMVAPLGIARGTQNKILEAMAMGVPVVTSSIAAGGVDAQAGRHFLVADTDQAYVEAILRLLDDPAERRRLGSAGRERMLSHHAWPSSMKRLDAIIEDCRRLFRERAVAR